jgi:hypothetical protein
MFSLNSWPGQFSYVLIAISYWLTDMFWLLAVVGLSLETAQLSSVSSARINMSALRHKQTKPDTLANSAFTP